MRPKTSMSKKRPRLQNANRGPQNMSYSFISNELKDSTAQGKYALQWMLGTLKISDFFSNYFEKKPLLLKNKPEKFHELLSIENMRELVQSGVLKYGSDLDVTKYSPESGRKTLNKDQNAKAGKEAWNLFSNDRCSLRMLRPQDHSTALWTFCSALEMFLDCMVGSNAYLTPVNSQGFAPHFDDIDAFICQVHGRKRWRVYARREDGHDVLPRVSSIDFTQDDLKDTAVLIDAVLEPGDMLYLPRGAIHQAECPADADEGESSLHVTISAFQKWTWADLLLESFKTAIQSAAASDVSLRRTLPLRFAEYAGVSKGDQNPDHRERLHRGVRKAMKKVAELYPTDVAADILAERFMLERLPPPPILASGNDGCAKRQKLNLQSITGKTLVCAVGRGCARLVVGNENSGNGEGLPRLIHCMGNSRAGGTISTETEDVGLPCLPEEAYAIEIVLKAYPSVVRVRDLPLERMEDRVELVQGLVEMGVFKIEE